MTSSFPTLEQITTALGDPTVTVRISGGNAGKLKVTYIYGENERAREVATFTTTAKKPSAIASRIDVGAIKESYENRVKLFAEQDAFAALTEQSRQRLRAHRLKNVSTSQVDGDRARIKHTSFSVDEIIAIDNLLSGMRSKPVA